MVHLSVLAAESCTISLHRSPFIPPSQCVSYRILVLGAL